MKPLAAIAIASALAAPAAVAKPNASVRVMTPVARVVEVRTLVDEPGKVRVAFAVVDTGGSTDVSPTQQLYLTLYLKGEMFSTDATFDLGPIFSLKGAKRTNPGLYEADVEVAGEKDGMPKKATIVVNAGAAVDAIKSLKCKGDEFDCAASKSFKASVDVTTK